MSQNSPRRTNSSTTNLRFVSSIRDATVELRCSTCESMLGDPPDTLFIDGGAVDAKRPLVPRRAPSYGFSNVSPILTFPIPFSQLWLAARQGLTYIVICGTDTSGSNFVSTNE